MNNTLKKIRYIAEAAILVVLLSLFRLLPLDRASALGGWLGRTIGPRLATTRKAKRNVEAALPGLNAQRQDEIISAMWDNLGRVFAEYPHLETIGRTRVTFENAGIIETLIAANQPFMVISAHSGNWEIAAAAMLARFDKPLDLTYRAPNNPWVDKMLLRARTLGGVIKAYPKSRGGGQEIVRAMREGRYIAMLVDQKYNEGIEMPFLGRPAMTNPAFAQLAQKFGYPVIPVRIERQDGARFTITIEQPLATDADNTTGDILAQAHTRLEDWICQQPGQWLWLHRRWKE